MKIIKLDFKKTTDIIDSSSYGNVDLNNTKNLKNIEKYVIPIIAQNEGWDTTDVTMEGFKKDPFQYQDELDATLFANVHVALDDEGNPLGLIEYLEESLEKPLSKVRMNNIKNMVEDRSSWSKLIQMKIVDESTVDKYFPKLKSYMLHNKIYSEIGVVVRADLQGKKSGVAEKLFELLYDGMLFAWTNNALLIAQWKKYFRKLQYYPLLEDPIDSLEVFASLAVLYSDLLTYDKSRWINLRFGTQSSPYFISSRSNHYLKLAEDLANKGKITKLDEERIKYCIGKESVQGALFAFN